MISRSHDNVINKWLIKERTKHKHKIKNNLSAMRIYIIF